MWEEKISLQSKYTFTFVSKVLYDALMDSYNTKRTKVWQLHASQQGYKNKIRARSFVSYRLEFRDSETLIHKIIKRKNGK
jgi:hypothetical protein